VIKIATFTKPQTAKLSKTPSFSLGRLFNITANGFGRGEGGDFFDQHFFNNPI
jgi:hypothetical protein